MALVDIGLSAAAPRPVDLVDVPRPADRLESLAGPDAAFQGEPVDPRWSSAISSAIESALVARNGLRPLAHSVECRSRTCRITLREDGAADPEAVLSMFQARRDLGAAAIARVDRGTGAATTVLYLSRPTEAPAR
ncbi:MAG TPA: hypothetical protein VGD37_20785 [Kofleriaceae bacterium]|jgi:hypothetical protein